MGYNSFAFLSDNYIFISTGLLIIFSILINWIVNFNIKNKNIKLIIKLGILLRIVIIIIDNYFQIISFGGADGKVFHLNGWLGLNNFPYWDISFIKSVVVPSYKLLGEAVPIFIVLLNFLGYTLAIIYLYKSMNLINEKKSKRKFLLFLIISFSLVSALLNVSLLREGIMLFFTTFSIYCYMKKEKVYMILSVISISISAYFHSGMVFIIFGYIYNFVMKQKGQKKFFYIIFGIVLLILIVLIIFNLPYFKGRDLESLSKKAIEDAGSKYASEVSSSAEYILTSPIRLFYFLFSPTPNMFRGIRDIISFLLNSCIYIFFIYDSIKNYNRIRKKINIEEKIFIQSLVISFFVTAYAYAMGTTTAGTALRHRDKLLFLLALINFYVYSKKERIVRIRKYQRRKNV
ncbi:hypothetical protein VSU16_12385 (plasmid) [Cetobacterium somerae]|uniref:hypothetical protein n=1 Tax=Cetobacterium somerae TaxID=188913 RepID=UPI002E7BD3B9|nr:hypothetical protein [Cetobacterium somerae]WVJ02313.1 hypothetical protein VSU16_12385 [Cetobacterium somerae]